MKTIIDNWAPIALLITLVGSYITLMLNARNRQLEIKLQHQAKLKYEAAQNFVKSYTDMRYKVKLLDNHLKWGSYERKDLLPVLTSYDIAYTAFEADAELVKFIFSHEQASRVNELIELMKGMTHKVTRYLEQRINEQQDLGAKYRKETVEGYKEAISEMIPKIPVLGQALLTSLSEELKLK